MALQVFVEFYVDMRSANFDRSVVVVSVVVFVIAVLSFVVYGVMYPVALVCPVLLVCVI